ncbi:amblin-like [Rhipicephalus microplus]|uniref:amblin-like n=1 Tax=Rhipicephalus microplus TaxID=6941 RepID=UPI003F6BDED7
MEVWGRCIAFIAFTACAQESAATVHERYYTIARYCFQPRPSPYCEPLKNAWYYQNGCCRKADPHLCGGGENIFASKHQCLKKCKYGKIGNQHRCAKPPIFGSCKALLQTWRYDRRTGYCKRLNYTICDFGIAEIATEEGCILDCEGNKDPKIVCSLTPRSTFCNLFNKLQWFFNAELNKCFSFPVGLCAKNSNGFTTKKECLNRCRYKIS